MAITLAAPALTPPAAAANATGTATNAWTGTWTGSGCLDASLTKAGPSPLASNGGFLLTTDGTGFFSADVATVAVRAASIDTRDVVAATDAVALDITDYYFGRTTEVFVNSPGRSTRAVIIDGDVAVPGHPTVFTVGGVQTLYLHWTTAEADISQLLDVPEFEAHVQDSNTGAPCSAPPLAPGDVPQEVLAYVDETPRATTQTTAATSDRLALTPLADTAPTENWPYPFTAAALLATAGGIVLHRRDKFFGDRVDASTPAEALLVASRPALPVADMPPQKKRVIYLDGETTADDPHEATSRAPQRQIDLHARRSESPLTKLVEKVSEGAEGPILSREAFAQNLNAEWSRHQNGGEDGAVASLVLSELEAVKLRLGKRAADELFMQVAEEITDIARPLDVVGLAGDYELAILMPETTEAIARKTLDHFAKRVAAQTFSALGERVLLTPATGFALLSDTKSAPDLIRAIENARTLSMLNLHLDAERWDDSAAPLHKGPSEAGPTQWHATKAKLRTPLQILLTVVLAWGVPFGFYMATAAAGFDISFPIYLLVVCSLVITGAFILAEGFMAIKQKEPPLVPSQPYPKATALIAAYMPNEAGTVIETIDAFLAMDYPNDLQIILAYNTPDPLPVEEHLDRIAAEHPNFVPVRIVGSNSKAQNVNAALSMAEGEFIGMFDADHQPRPDAFTRAWRWIDDGYDVVQGHCLTRNGDAGFLAKMIAVEFESIYAVAHPGRAKMHRFGVFGGSNGFWRTELLHETRMRGSMLTEDIDSSMRVVERGFKIRSDRDLVSRELATTTFRQIWNQRMRWAQGWFQVSIEHMKLAHRSKDLTVRQKLGIFHLLMWRELYPWLSQQLFPLLAFWAWRDGGLHTLNWTIPIFLAAAIFTFSVGPLQTVFAYKLADNEIKQHKSWFWLYLLFTTPFYTEYKNLIARVAHIKQFMKESDWRVTPRSEDPED